MFWTLDFIRQWSPYFSLPSVFDLRDQTLREARGSLAADRIVELAMKRPVSTKFRMREMSSDFLMLEEVLLHGVYNSLLQYVGACRTIVDLGANIGVTSLFLGGKFPSAQLVGVEPHPATYELLQYNLSSLIRQGRYAAVNAAVWDRPAQLSCRVPDAGRYSGASVGEPQSGETPVVGYTMSEIFRKHQLSTVDLLKIDIEGAEVQLFGGDTAWLEQVGAMAIEFHGDSRSRSNFDSVVAPYGFAVVDSAAHTVVAIRS